MFETILAVVSLVVTAGGFLISLLSWSYIRKAQRENMQAQTVTEDARASESYAKASEMVVKELVDVRIQLNEFKQKMDAQDEMIVGLTRDKADLKDWAERLVHQLQSYGYTPVPFRAERPDKPAQK